ncbi:metallophosphoesterase [Candidatus Saganbacteria bacterium]|nr:metallophosphoesterase [Candidatus Saganbacteria bacterium]
MTIRTGNRHFVDRWWKRSGPSRREQLETLGSRLKGAGPLPVIAAIPDIHGNHLAVENILNRLEKMRAARVFMGDYFDRGNANLKVYRQLREEKTILLGNHEQYFLLAMRGDIESFVPWAANGGRAFFEECGIHLGVFWQLFYEFKAALPADYSAENIMLEVYRRHPQLIFEAMKAVMENPKMLEVFDWLADRGRLYHLDENGILYIHGGIPAKLADRDIFDYLDHLEQKFKKLLASRRPSPAMVSLVANQLSDILYTRGVQFIDPLKPGGETAVDRYLRGMGVMGLVCAHTIKRQVEVTGGRIFEIDLGMAHSPQGSFITIGRDGVKSFREVDGGQFVEDTLVTEDAWRAKMQKEADSLLT